MDANEGLRESVDEDKHVRCGPDPRQSVVENPWIDNSKFAMVRWINTRDRLQCIWNWLEKCGLHRQKTSAADVCTAVCLIKHTIKADFRRYLCTRYRIVRQVSIGTI